LAQITVPASDRPKVTGRKCCHTMTIGTRSKFGRGGVKQKTYTMRRGKKMPCPLGAVVVIDGKGYCKMHAPVMPD
jgi:hypothetical protein